MKAYSGETSALEVTDRISITVEEAVPIEVKFK